MSDAAPEPEPGEEPARTIRAVVPFDVLFDEEYPRMVALAAAVSGRRDDAEDLAQEAMTRLDREWDRVQHLASPGGWLRRVTINMALSRRRRLGSEVRAIARLRPESSTLPPSSAEHEPVWQAVAALPGNQRATVALHYLEDRSIAEIADILEISPSTARVHLHRARAALRTALEDFAPCQEASR